MHVLVIGAGVVGVTTALELRARGLEVTVLERRPGVAQEASHGDSGLLSAACAGPRAQPGLPTRVLRGLLRRNSPLLVRPSLDPARWRWLLRWFGECRLERFRVNEQRMQRLAEYSRVVLGELRNRHSLTYEQSRGWLRLFRSDTDLGRARPSIELLAQAGTPHRLLDSEACRVLEPALADATPLAGGLYLTEDETGNCAYFARRVRDLAASHGVDFRFEATATALAIDGGKCTGARTALGTVTADAVVLAAGVDSPRLLRRTGIRLPLCPVKGCSLTANITQHECAPSMSIMDDASQVTITRLGNRLRIAGIAELGNRSLGLRDNALGVLLGVARHWFPGAAAYGKAQAWVGTGAILPDGPPVLGITPVSNLYLNIGHGSTGWTMACGAARIVADIVAGRQPQIDLDGLTIARYQHRREA